MLNLVASHSARAIPSLASETAGAGGRRNFGLILAVVGLLVPGAGSALASGNDFTLLIRTHGQLETLAGTGTGRRDDVNYWQTGFEGGPATNAALSRPHYAMADGAGNLFIADKNSHAVLRVAPNGIITTFAGTHAGGFNGDGPMTATNLQLNFPNALWVRADGTVYVLDTDNGRVCRVTPDGRATTLFRANKHGDKLAGGRQLWVKDDESLAYFGNKTRLRQWTGASGMVTTLAEGFTELGCFFVEPDGSLLVADRGGHRVYRVTAAGAKAVVAGNGSTRGGGDGFPALQTGFNGPRGIWAAPGGGYFLLLHDGAQLWFVDAGGTAHLLVNGAGGTARVHDGDGRTLFSPDELKIGEGRSVTVDTCGDLILCESDYGFIRRIRLHQSSTNWSAALHAPRP